MSMLELSEHILAVGKQNDLRVTNLQLQKVMYFAIKDYVKIHHKNSFIESVYDEPFETWQYGPVVPELYYDYNLYGSMAIDSEGKYNEQYQVFDKSIIENLKENVFNLVEKSHREAFWQKYRQQAVRKEYTLDDIVGD
jgi:uncharacterized phage-associated protein